jgi:anthranilate synthase/aminodeoxychorismate synthase-like glutamine amidotransferase
MTIFLLDNYDSFTYNLVHYLGELKQKVEVARNNEITADAVVAKRPQAILISPGPCDPDKAGITLELIKKAAENKIPLLGVCLGHQAIAQAFGGKVIRAEIPMHGKVSEIHHTGKGIFENIPNPFHATRYHSLIVEMNSLPSELEVTAVTKDDTIMAIAHKTYNIHGVQFHPESIASEYGHKLIENFIKHTI